MRIGSRGIQRVFCFIARAFGFARGVQRGRVLHAKIAPPRRERNAGFKQPQRAIDFARLKRVRGALGNAERAVFAAAGAARRGNARRRALHHAMKRLNEFAVAHSIVQKAGKRARGVRGVQREQIENQRKRAVSGRVARGHPVQQNACRLAKAADFRIQIRQLQRIFRILRRALRGGAHQLQRVQHVVFAPVLHRPMIRERGALVKGYDLRIVLHCSSRAVAAVRRTFRSSSENS